MEARLEQVAFQDVPWHELDTYPDRTLFQSAAWLAYVTEAQGAKPIFLRAYSGSATVGYFTGATVSRLGLRILGSPFKGWGTPYMGFNTVAGADRRALFEALATYALKTLRCHHVELVDGAMKNDCADGGTSTFDTMEVDLTPSVDDLFHGLAPSYRRNIRKANKNGVLIERASPGGFRARVLRSAA